jgi:hypothetical protein
MQYTGVGGMQLWVLTALLGLPSVHHLARRAAKQPVAGPPTREGTGVRMLVVPCVAVQPSCMPDCAPTARYMWPLRPHQFPGDNHPGMVPCIQVHMCMWLCVRVTVAAVHVTCSLADVLQRECPARRL